VDTNAIQKAVAVAADGPVPALDENEHGFPSLMPIVGVFDEYADVS